MILQVADEMAAAAVGATVSRSGGIDRVSVPRLDVGADQTSSGVTVSAKIVT
jgi:hypothetical protein